MKVQILKPTDGDSVLNSVTVFLAGSIEMGAAEDWQTIVSNKMEELEMPITLFNPRRDSWDSSWEQRESNPQFSQQVNWEMDRLNECDIIFMYFSPGTKSPISLLELGLHADSGKMIVCCPDEFWRKGNVEIVCSRYKIPLHDNLEHAMMSLSSVTSSELINKL
jgi:hypothetical protein